MSVADNLLRKLDTLEAALALRKSGVPTEIVAVCYSDDPHDVAAAKRQMLDFYGIKDEEVLETAGSEIQVSAFPWAQGRGVGITSNVDSRIPEPLKDQALLNLKGKELAPVIGTGQHIGDTENPAVEE